MWRGLIAKPTQINDIRRSTDINQPTSGTPRKWVREVFREDVRCHRGGWLVHKFEQTAHVGLMKKRDADTMCAAQAPHGLVAARLTDTYGDVVVFVDSESGTGKKKIPYVLTGKSYGAQAVVQSHQLGLRGAVANGPLALGNDSDWEARVWSAYTMIDTSGGALGVRATRQVGVCVEVWFDVT